MQQFSVRNCYTIFSTFKPKYRKQQVKQFPIRIWKLPSISVEYLVLFAAIA